MIPVILSLEKTMFKKPLFLFSFFFFFFFFSSWKCENHQLFFIGSSNLELNHRKVPFFFTLVFLIGLYWHIVCAAICQIQLILEDRRNGSYDVLTMEGIPALDHSHLRYILILDSCFMCISSHVIFMFKKICTIFFYLFLFYSHFSKLTQF